MAVDHDMHLSSIGSSVSLVVPRGSRVSYELGEFATGISWRYTVTQGQGATPGKMLVTNITKCLLHARGVVLR